MSRIRPGVALLVAILAGVTAAPVLVWAPRAAAAAPAPVAFALDPASPLAQQDQLAAQLAAATAQHRPLRVESGSVTLTRTLWLPVGGRLMLSARATLTGSIPGQSLVRLQSGSRLSGGTIWNRSSADCFDVDVADRTTGAMLDGVTLRGGRTNAVYVNAPDVQDLTLRGNRFVGTTYGVLVNPGAARARRITIDRNTFLRTTGDAIEVNTPVADAAKAVRSVTITRNVVRDMRGAGSGSGFAVGVAGVRGFRIAENRMFGVRNEAVHLEAKAAHGVVENNLIMDGGAGERPAIAVYRTVDDVVIRGNVLDRFRGGGIAVLWDSVGSSTRITVARNLIRRVTGDGIVMGGDTGTGPFVTRRNVVIGAQNGIVTLGVHQHDLVAHNLVRDVRARPLASAYRGASRRTVVGNSSARSTTIHSVIGATVVDLARTGYAKPTPQARNSTTTRPATRTAAR